MSQQATLFEKSSAGRRALQLPELDSQASPEQWIPNDLLRAEAPRLPELSQLDVVRHYVKLSQLNVAIDTTFYPLGSCTMKYNPKICDWVGQLPGFTQLHPETDPVWVQGTLALLYRFQEYMKDLTGFDAVTLQPAAGAHGELLGMIMIKAHLAKIGQSHRNEVIIPDSAHGTNPASAAMCGFKVVEIPSNATGTVDLDALKKVLSSKTAAIMLTNPNTVGLFEKDILQITQAVHEAGGYCYYDGANLNAIMGQAKIAHMGFDVMHMNTHKTFATPHGGGGPGSGPVCVTSTLEPYLPKPVIQFDANQYVLSFDRPDSVGQIKLFFGNTEVLLRAFAYVESYGAQGLKAVSDMAVLNANYLKTRLKDTYYVPFMQHCMHEFIMTSKHQHVHHSDVTTMTIAKRLLDYGYHPPTVYFPLIVPEVMMIEPTETESLETLDKFVEAMLAISRECETTPELVATAPHTTPVKRVDEVTAARNPDLNYFRH